MNADKARKEQERERIRNRRVRCGKQRKRAEAAVMVATAKRANNLCFAIDGSGSDHQLPREIEREREIKMRTVLIYLKCNFSSFQASYVVQGFP